LQVWKIDIVHESSSREVIQTDVIIATFSGDRSNLASAPMMKPPPTYVTFLSRAK